MRCLNIVRRLTALLVGAAALLSPAPASAQITLLGKTQHDQFLSAFWGQNLNTSNLFAGIHANAGTNKWAASLLPDIVTPRSYTGTNYGTNGFQIWFFDGNASPAVYEKYVFEWSDSLPLGSNNISRIGREETLDLKTLKGPKLALANGTLGSGIPKANGGSPLSFITPKSGTNRVYIQTTYPFLTTPTNYIETVDGVVTDIR